MPQREKKLINSVKSFVETIDDFFNDSPKKTQQFKPSLNRRRKMFTRKVTGKVFEVFK